jgi:hypothetical protein
MRRMKDIRLDVRLQTCVTLNIKHNQNWSKNRLTCRNFHNYKSYTDVVIAGLLIARRLSFVFHAVNKILATTKLKIIASWKCL